MEEIEVALIERIIEDFIKTHPVEEEEKSINLEDSGSSKLLNSEQEEYYNLMMQQIDKTMEIHYEQRIKDDQDEEQCSDNSNMESINST